MKSTCTLTVILNKQLKKAFEETCQKNKFTTQEVLETFCTQYVESGGISSFDEKKSKDLNGIPT